MRKSMSFKLSLPLFLLLLCTGKGFPCSMYKLTVGDKTMVGNNEDSWRLTSMIRFEPRTDGRFGAVYVGYSDKAHPDGGMNEFGLVFDAFSMPHKPRIPDRDPAKEDFSYEQLKTILRQYKTVDEVQSFFEKRNLQLLNGSPLFHGGMLLFVDRTGNYLVVEADKLSRGNRNKLVLANFSYANTDPNTVRMERYRNGVAFLENRIDTGLAFCTALSDTMSVNREKAGDGTLYTSIYDLRDGLIHTYFFHDYSRRITFNLKEELAKGEHTYLFSDLFPDNAGYQKFIGYKTPQNSLALFGFMACCGLLFLFSSLYFAVRFVRTKPKEGPNPFFRNLQPALSVLCLALSCYICILLTNQAVFYFPSPYTDGRFSVVTLASYLPFVLLLCILPLWVANIKLFNNKVWGQFAKWLFAVNNTAYAVLVFLFLYWGLFGF